jgi:carbon storage regulator
MLVLTRKPRERIVIGNQTVVTVLEIRGGKVKLGIEAPSEISVHREEIVELVEGSSVKELDGSDPASWNR